GDGGAHRRSLPGFDAARHRARHGRRLRPRRARYRPRLRPHPCRRQPGRDPGLLRGAATLSRRCRLVTAPLLRLQGIDTYYGDSHILQGVSLDLPAGSVLALLGRNGAGKTTLLRAIMGIVPPRSGRIVFAGSELTGLPPHRIARSGIAYVPETR